MNRVKKSNLELHMKLAIYLRGGSTASRVAALCLAALLGGCAKQIPDTIKIGVAQPLSGSIAELGQDMLDGATMAVEEINRKGFTVDGKPVKLEIVAVDDKGDPAAGKAAAQQLVDAGVVAVIGHLNSGVSIEAAPVYAAANVAQLAISTNPKYTQLGFGTTLRLVANDALQAKAMGGYAAGLRKAGRYAVIDEGSTYGVGLADGAAVRLGELKKEVVLRQSFDGKTVAFDELATKIKGEKIDVIVSMLNDFQAIALMQALVKLDHKGVSFVGGDTIKSTAMLKGNGLAEAIAATSPLLSVEEFVGGGRFQTDFTERFKHPVAYGAHYAYDGVHVVAGALNKAKSAKSADVLAQLRRGEHSAPVSSTMSWNAEGERSYGAVGVYEMRDSQWKLRSRSDRW